MKPILLVLQCYPGDQEMAMKLARLLADLEPVRSPHSFLFVFRWDCEPDMETVKYVGRKFSSVHTFRSSRKTSGHPMGCNDLFFSAFGHVCMNVRQKFWDFDTALYFESDCVPMARDWINQLQAEWYERDQMVLGFLLTQEDHPVAHINGNCMISPRYQKVNRNFFFAPRWAGWDTYHGKSMLKHGRASRLIYSDYARKTITRDELFAPRKYGEKHPLHGQEIHPALIHGIKGMDAFNIIKEEFGL